MGGEMKSRFSLLLERNIHKCIEFPKYKYKVTLIVGKNKVNALGVSRYVRLENYLSDLFATHFIDINTLPSDYYTLMQWGRNDIKVKLDRLTSDNILINSTMYYGVLLNTSNAQLDNNVGAMQDMDIMDKTNIETVSLQLVDIAAYTLLSTEVGGMYNGNTAADVYRLILAAQTLDDTYSDGNRVNTITFDSETVKTVQRTIIIKDGTPLVNVGDVLQRNYGIFDQGFGVFLKDGNWQVFAPYNVKKSKNNTDRLVIINAPENRYRGTEKTYFKEGNTHTVISTAKVSMSQLSDSALNSGTGARYADPTKLADGFSGSDSDPKLKPKDYMTEYTGVEYYNPLKATFTNENVFESNPSHISSRLAATGGVIAAIGWDNGIIDGLIPGMPVSFVYEANMNMHRMEGTLISAVCDSSLPNGNLVDGVFTNAVTLTVFLKEIADSSNS